MWPPSEAAALGMSLGRRSLSEHLIDMVRQEHGEQYPQLELAEKQQKQEREREQKRPWPWLLMSLAPIQRRA